MSVMTEHNCTIDLIGSATVKSDGTLTVEVTHDVAANFAFGVGDAAATERSFVPILFTTADGEIAQTHRNGFSDVTGGVHKPAVDALAQAGQFDGSLCGEDMFCPNEPIDRSTMAVWLIRALDDSEPPATGESRFADVDAGQWWAPYVERLAELEITGGCKVDPLRYCPDRAVTRAQMASFLVRAFALDAAGPAGFTDIEGSTHAANIDALAAAGVTGGCTRDPLRGLRTDATITCWGRNVDGEATAPT